MLLCVAVISLDGKYN